MTFKDLQKAVQSLIGPGDNQVLQRLRDKPFWLWDPTSHKQADRASKGNCCFNHIIGLPTKDGIIKPMFEYERMLYKALLEVGYLNSNPPLHSNDPNNIAHKFNII